jgi:hypothetical protein
MELKKWGLRVNGKRKYNCLGEEWVVDLWEIVYVRDKVDVGYVLRIVDKGLGIVCWMGLRELEGKIIGKEGIDGDKKEWLLW